MWVMVEITTRNTDLTVAKFRNWVISHFLLSIQTPQTTEYNWISDSLEFMKNAGFQYFQISKGFIDYHEHSNVKVTASNSWKLWVH